MAIEATGNTKLQTAAPRAMNAQEQKFHTVKKLIADNLKGITSALPKHLDANRFARIVVTLVQKTPKLMECTQESFIGSLLSAAALGLELEPMLGQAYLVPFRSKGKLCCQLIPGYRGLNKLARQSGEIATIDAHEVSFGDFFDYGYGSDPYLKHKPAECPIIEVDGVKQLDPNWRPGFITHFYAIAKFKDGSVQFTVMPLWMVNEIRDNSEGYKYAKENGINDNPWLTDYLEMGKKTAMRRLAKMLPASTDKSQLLQKIVTADEQGDRGIQIDSRSFIDVEAVITSEPEAPAEEGKRAPVEGAK